MNDGTRDLKQVARLQALASSVRRRDLEMVYGAKLGHIGGDFSAIDILVTLYFGVLRIDPSRPDDPERDTKVKRADYAEAGIPEYWIVNPEDETITVLTLSDDSYREHGVFRRGSVATSVLLQGFVVDVDAVLDAS